MKNLKVLFLMLVLGSATQAYSAGLSGGEQFSTQDLSGNLTVQCNSSQGVQTAFATCRGQILNPGEYSYFVGPQTDADQVTLRATREDVSVSKAKTEDYNGPTGKSKKSFNLWISTVFQRPLLGYGKNTVKYTLTKNGKTTEEGTFIVTVVDGGNSTCQRHGFYFSNLASDCSNPTLYCDRYFSENNYCK